MDVNMDEKRLDARRVLSEFVAFRNSLREASEDIRSTLARNVSIAMWLFGIVTIAITFLVGENI